MPGQDQVRQSSGEARRGRRVEPTGLVRCAAPRFRSRASQPFTSRGFTIVVLLVLTLGIGATTAIFSVVDAVVLRRLPFDGSDRLVGISRIDLRDGSAQFAGFDAADATDYRQRQDVFEALAAVPEGPIPLTLRSDPFEQIYATRSTADLFAMLQVQPQLGRLFAAEHEIGQSSRRADQRRPVASPVRRRSAGSRQDPGGWIRHAGDHRRPAAKLHLAGGRPQTSRRVDTVGRSRQREVSRDGGRARYISLIGRRSPASRWITRADRSDQSSLAAEHPAWFKDEGIRVRPLVDAIVGDRVQSWMWMLLGAVAFVLLIACVNVANLCCSRARRRARWSCASVRLSVRRDGSSWACRLKACCCR